MILSDQETKIDLLNNEAIAATIVSLLAERPESPVTIGVHGDWGAGKSSVLEMVESALVGKDDVLCLKFNGWRFQGFEDAKIVLLEGIVDGLIEARPALTKAAIVAKDLFRRIDWLKVAKKAGGLALTLHTGIPTPDQIQSVVATVSGFLGHPGSVITEENAKAAMSSVQSLLKPAESKHVPEEIQGFRREFETLLKEAGIKQLVVLVDDLDRCLPETAIETLEAIRLFILTSRTAFVIAADEGMIEYAVRKHFPDLPESSSPLSYSRNYLEKLIQVPFRIPALGVTETRVYVTLLLVAAELPDDDAKFLELANAARVRLAKPWDSKGVDAEVLKSVFGDLSRSLSDALFLSEQIGPVLADGTQGNPRQIKRFLNSLLLRHRIAKERKLSDEIKMAVLAKLMLAERFQPKLFDQLSRAAAQSPGGICADIATLEKAITLKPTTTEKETAENAKSAAKTETQTVLAEWMASDAVKDWAKTLPTIGEEDLRPYFFITRDRRGYFGGVTALGHLEEIAAKLMGPKLSIGGLAGELKTLKPPETHKLFEVVKQRIITNGKFDKTPSGVDGLCELVKVNPALQGSLVDLLEGLPITGLGSWVTSGWADVITEAVQKKRLQDLMTKWSESTTNKALAIAAKGVSKFRK